jgi:hypothetical protein
MKQQMNDLSLATSSLEHDLLEIEMRTMAQKAAAKAFARLVRRGLIRTRRFLVGTRVPATDGDLRSA